MPAYSGSALFATWVAATPAGTVQLNTDYQTLTYTPSIEKIDTTAGADTAKEFILGMKDGAVAYTAIQQAAGTALIPLLAEGVMGTLTIAPEGTATGKQKMIVPAMSEGITWNWAYNDKVIMNVAWSQTAARTDSVY